MKTSYRAAAAIVIFVLMGYPSFAGELKVNATFGDDIIFKPEQIITSGSEIFVLERSDESIKIFSTKGKLLKTIGGKGGGPGEFSSGLSFALHGEKIFVLDTLQQKIHVFENKRYLSSHRYKSLNFGFPPYALAVSPNGDILLVTPALLKEHTLITRLDNQFKPVKGLVPCKPLYKNFQELRDSDDVIRLFLNNGYAAATRSKIYYLYYLTNQLLELSPGGKILGIYKLPLEPLGKKAKVMTFSDGSFDLERRLNYDLKIKNAIPYILSRNEKGHSIIYRLENGKLMETYRIKEALYGFDIADKKLYGIDIEKSLILVYHL